MLSGWRWRAAAVVSELGRQGVRVLDWQGQLWVNMAELPRVVRESAGVRAGWREWARRLR